MLFKNIPSTKSQDSLILSKAGRCVYTLTGAVSYKKYIDLAFQGKDVPMGSGALDIAQSF